MDISTRHRPLKLLAIVVAAQVLLLAFQVRRADRSQRRDVPLVRYWTVEMITPIERAGTWTFSRIGGFWDGYVAVRATREENLRLRAENDQLKLRNRELESEATERQRLEVLLNFRQAHPEAPMVVAQVVGSSGPMLAAQVIGASADPNSHTIFINRGERDHIRRNMGVITPDGIVGKIVEVFPSTSQALLINDRESGVGALFAASRTHGVLKGPDPRVDSRDPNPRMEYIVNDEKVQAGDTIVTSGEDRIFPKGLPIGVVADAKQANPFQIIHVRTAARLDRLEDVLVLLTQQELNLKKAEESSSWPPTGASSAGQKPASQVARPASPRP
jgi:rod shape-determining protein MreC